MQLSSFISRTFQSDFGIVNLNEAPLFDTCDTSSSCGIKGNCGTWFNSYAITEFEEYKQVFRTPTVGIKNNLE